MEKLGQHPLPSVTPCAFQFSPAASSRAADTERQQAISNAKPESEHTSIKPVQTAPSPGLASSTNLLLSRMESARDIETTAQSDVKNAQAPASNNQTLMVQASHSRTRFAKLEAKATAAHKSARTDNKSP